VIDLAKAGSKLQFPTELPSNSFKTINSLFEGKTAWDDPGKLNITLGPCVMGSIYTYVGSEGYLSYTVVNRDKFNEWRTNVNVLPPYAYMNKDGEIEYRKTGLTLSVGAGPGATAQGQTLIYDNDPEATHIVVYRPSNQYDVYITSDCRPKPK
jgi:hypothetical protein